MEFWLLRSLSHELFLFTMEFWLSRSISHELFFFMMEFWLSRSLSHDKIHKMHKLGEDSFHIYHKEYLHRTRLVKNLASWFRAPLQGKEYNPSYSNEIAKRKANVFVPEITYTFVIGSCFSRMQTCEKENVGDSPRGPL
jgi:hypothetical protein